MNPFTKLSAGILCGLLTSCGLTAHAQDKPNIVFILADDMGYGDLSSYNSQSQIFTPHLDQFARTGMVFTDAHAGGSTCIPSRYSLLTGRFSARMQRGKGPLIAEGQATIASLLRENGYRTAMVGKWHQGFDQDVREKSRIAVDYNQAFTGGPVDRGFDSFFGMHASLDIPPYFYMKDRAPLLAPTETVEDSTSVGGQQGWNKIQGAFWRGGNVAPDFKHHEVTPRFADEAVQVIQTHDGQKPLFLYLALPSPHTPWLPAKEFIGKSRAGMYGDFVMTVDSVVGQVLASLDNAGMSNNTLVVFSSDNGPVWYDKDTQKFDHSSVGPLRGAKGSAWEGGHRMPFLVRWPGKVKAGTRNNHLVSFADLYATFGELAGQKQFSTSTAVDSVSFLPALLEPDRQHKKRPPILHGVKVIRDGDWKLIATKGSRGFTADRGQQFGIELYNLQDDLKETNNLADQMPEKVEGLRARISQILQSSSTITSAESRRK